MVLIDYVGKTDGDIFDLTLEDKAEEEDMKQEDMEYQPIPVLIGEDFVIEGLEEALLDMEVGEERELTIPKDKAYGDRDSDMVETYPEKEFEKQGVQVRPGEEIMIGQQRGKVRSVNSGRVRIDFNHPLAGKELDYWVRITEKIEEDEEIAQHIYDYRVGHGDIEFEKDTVKIPAAHSHGDHMHELPDDAKGKIRDEILENTGFEEVDFVEET